MPPPRGVAYSRQEGLEAMMTSPRGVAYSRQEGLDTLPPPPLPRGVAYSREDGMFYSLPRPPAWVRPRPYGADYPYR